MYIIYSYSLILHPAIKLIKLLKTETFILLFNCNFIDTYLYIRHIQKYVLIHFVKIKNLMCDRILGLFNYYLFFELKMN